MLDRQRQTGAADHTSIVEYLDAPIDNVEAALRSAHAVQVAALEALRKLAAQGVLLPLTSRAPRGQLSLPTMSFGDISMAEAHKPD